MPHPASAPTALMRQYLDVKAEFPDAILFFRLGDFYEMFFEDAVYVARVLGLTLTTRDKGKKDAVPMCGVPHHAARTYLARLTALGHRVAMCEQLEDPRMVKGIVKRGVVRVVTPGVIIDEETLDPRAPNFVAAFHGDEREGYGLAFLDVTTGDFRATAAVSREALIDELARVAPNELLHGRADAEVAALCRRAFPRVPLHELKPALEAPLHPGVGPGGSEHDVEKRAHAAIALLREALGARFEEAGLGPRLTALPMVAGAAARVLLYARSTQLSAPLPLAHLEIYARADHLILDEQARSHLELVATMIGGKREGSLLELLDVTRSAMGGRLLRRWLLFPARQVAAIRRRHDAVEQLVQHPHERGEIRQHLGSLGDIERLAGRAKLQVATPRDLAVLGRSLRELPALAAALRASAGGTIDQAALAPDALLDLGVDLGADLAERLGHTLDENAAAATKEGGFVRAGVSPELDELRSIATGGRDQILAIEARERARTGISSLKVKFNNVFGYYIEITRTHLANVPPDYVRKQTVANAERFVTAELSDYEAKILTADERRIAIELAIFQQLRADVGVEAGRLLALAGRVATVDALCALAEQAHLRGYVRPEIDESESIVLEDSRHPVVETLAAPGGFVPNDVQLHAGERQLLLVTGPNMAGKSTVIRQVALAVVMAQMGGFVAARAARIGICDRVFTRVGAGDNLARGESTFLVEMRETAHILRHATKKSLIVLDEIGRGTSTYDGVSIAWAVAEYLHDRIGARTLFATHYHELSALAESHPRVRNVAVAARELDGEVVFLRRLTEGAGNRSFGVEVGKLAGLPDAVVARAREILSSLESGRAVSGEGPQVAKVADGARSQLRLGLPGVAGESSAPRVAGPRAVPEVPGLGVDPDALRDVVAALRAAEPDDLSPRAAWALLETLRKKLT